MTALQQCALGLLTEFIAVCEKLELRWYLVCGSALGAVKYGGFIPWDDDVDVALPREDYEIFLARGQALLPEHIFLQNARTDPAFPLLFSKLRDSRTTCVELPHRKLRMHHGAYIDVFPLDGYPNHPAEQARFEKRKAYFERRRKVRLDYDRRKYPTALKTNAVYLGYRLFGLYGDTAKTMARYNAFLSGYSTGDSALWCNHGNWQGSREYAPREQYGDGAEAVFEGLAVRIPAGFDDYLTQKYGQWRSDPPRKESHHEWALCDLTRPCKDYSPEE